MERGIWQGLAHFLNITLIFEGRDHSQEGPISRQFSFVSYTRREPTLIRCLLFTRRQRGALNMVSYLILPIAF